MDTALLPAWWYFLGGFCAGGATVAVLAIVGLCLIRRELEPARQVGNSDG